MEIPLRRNFIFHHYLFLTNSRNFGSNLKRCPRRPPHRAGPQAVSPLMRFHRIHGIPRCNYPGWNLACQPPRLSHRSLNEAEKTWSPKSRGGLCAAAGFSPHSVPAPDSPFTSPGKFHPLPTNLPLKCNHLYLRLFLTRGRCSCHFQNRPGEKAGAASLTFFPEFCCIVICYGNFRPAPLHLIRTTCSE